MKKHNPTHQHLTSQLKQLTEKEKRQSEELEETRAMIASHLRVITLIEEDELSTNQQPVS